MVPSGPAAHESVRTARIRSRRRVVARCPDERRCPIERHGTPKQVPLGRIVCLELGLLRPGLTCPNKNIGAPRIRPGRSVIRRSTHHRRVTRHSHGGAKMIVRTRVGSRESGLLAPHRATAREHVCLARVGFCSGIRPIRSHHGRVAGKRHRSAEKIRLSLVIRREFRLQAPHAGMAHEHISAARISAPKRVF